MIDLDDAVHDPWLACRQEQGRKRREVAERDRAPYRGGPDDEDSGAAR